MRNKILDLLEHKGDPPPLPEVLVTLEKRINDPDCDIDEISTLIESDPILAGKLMKLSNTVYFGGGRDSLDTLASAVLRVGIKMVLDLAYTSTLPSLFKKSGGVNLRQFWKHSLAVAFWSHSLGMETRLEKEEKRSTYISGLMHDIGVLIFGYLIPDEYAKFIKESKGSSEFLGKLEKDRFGIDHSELGARFLEKWWPVSPMVVKAVAGHHSSGLTDGISANLPFIVCAANQLAHEHGIENATVEKFKNEPPLCQEHLDILGISPQRIESIIKETRESLAGVESLLY